jgi:hypothetical protein
VWARAADDGAVGRLAAELPPWWRAQKSGKYNEYGEYDEYSEYDEYDKIASY